MKELVSAQIVKYLEDRGIDHIFGLCGHTVIAFLAELEKSKKIRFINVRHEQIAAHAADGFARVTKKASVLMTHLGPGLTNAATGVANAALDSIPMVVIAGDVPTHYFGKHPHQEVNMHADGDQWEIYRPFVKRAWRVDRAELVPEILEKAFALAESGRPGPVLVDIPMDIFSKEIDTECFERVKRAAKEVYTPSIEEATAEKIINMIAEAKNPVIYTGGGVIASGSSDELKAFVEHFEIPVAHSLMGKGTLPDDYPLVMGMTGFWGTKFTNDHCREADCIIGFGTSFKEADCSSWYPEYTFDMKDTKLIHIDIDESEIGRNYPVEIGVVADLKNVLPVLNKVAKKLYPEGKKAEELKKAIAEYKKEFKLSNKKMEESNDFPMMPERILADLRAVLPRDAIITTDVGWNKNGVGQQFPIYEPGSFITPCGFATMGFGSPAAVGAKLAQPEKVVVSLIGDGGFGQNPSVLATAAIDNIPVVFVIMNNRAFGTIAGLEKAHYDTTFATVFEKDGEPYSPDFAAIAKAYGVEGVRIDSADMFKTELEKAIKSNKPYLLDVIMKNNPVPTAGHWNIMDIFSPGKKVHHAST